MNFFIKILGIVSIGSLDIPRSNQCLLQNSIMEFKWKWVKSKSKQLHFTIDKYLGKTRIMSNYLIIVACTMRTSVKTNFAILSFFFLVIFYLTNKEKCRRMHVRLHMETCSARLGVSDSWIMGNGAAAICLLVSRTHAGLTPQQHATRGNCHRSDLSFLKIYCCDI